MLPKQESNQNQTREYNELMEEVDHVVDYDWKSAAILLSKEYLNDINLDQEQNTILYGTNKPPTHTVPPILTDAQPRSRGWSKHNVVSSRVAWARVRQVESADRRWHNEDVAERDPTLALLSEATEIFLKSLLQGAVSAARRRQNLDGIRLWHMQHAKTKPPLSLRLGCDVHRQAALVDGNSAKVCHRMELALSRAKIPRRITRLDDPEVLYWATTMSDLSKRPKLEGAAEEADLEAKRKFEIFGGRASGAPPFGRVPKKSKLEIGDLMYCVQDFSFPWQTRG